MAGIKDQVAIIGVGCTNFAEHWDKDLKDLVIDACYEAFEDAGIEPKDIQAAWWSSVLSEMGRSLGRYLKTDFIPITRVENKCASGQDAFANACFSVAAGVYDLVLVCGGEKLKDSGVGAAGMDPATPYTNRADTLWVPPTSFAQFAQRYFHHYGIDPGEGRELLARIAVKNHHNGCLAPKAQFHREITLEQALKAPIVAPPLGLFDCCGVTDGAAAAIITRTDLAKKYRDDYVLVKGFGMSTGKYQAMTMDDWPMVHIEENVRASRRAYEMAGIKNPRKEIDLAAVHDCFTIHELVIYEDLGFSPRGKAREDVLAGTFELTGELPVNTDGGLKCFGHPVGATGLRMIYEIYKQLQGKAEARQVKGAKIGLVNGIGGTPIDGQTAAVVILGKRE